MVTDALEGGLLAGSAALLGATLLSSCAPAEERNPVQLICGANTPLPAPGSDSTNLPPSGWKSAGTAAETARAGVVKLTYTNNGYTLTGSGWIAEPGRIVTNAHVTKDAPGPMTVTDSEGHVHDGVVLATDPKLDISKLKVDGLTDQPLPMDDVLEEGEEAEAVGYPARKFEKVPVTAALQIDVDSAGQGGRSTIMFSGTTVPGISGGPMVNGSGEVVATAFATGSLTGDGTEAPKPFVMGIHNRDVQAMLRRAGAAA